MTKLMKRMADRATCAPYCTRPLKPPRNIQKFSLCCNNQNLIRTHVHTGAYNNTIYVHKGDQCRSTWNNTCLFVYSGRKWDRFIEVEVFIVDMVDLTLYQTSINCILVVLGIFCYFQHLQIKNTISQIFYIVEYSCCSLNMLSKDDWTGYYG
jgi:hypothetical protein